MTVSENSTSSTGSTGSTSSTSATQVFEQSIVIQAPLVVVDRTITDRDLMHQWLNPALRCDPVGEWSTDLGTKSRFVVQLPLVQPTLNSTVIERRMGLVVWEFDGFFQGCDRWECWTQGGETRLVNQFRFSIPNPLIAFGFNRFALTWTREDMQAQLLRLKQVAEAEAIALQS